MAADFPKEYLTVDVVLSSDDDRTVLVHVTSPLGTATAHAKPELLELLGSGSFRQPFKGSYGTAVKRGVHLAAAAFTGETRRVLQEVRRRALDGNQGLRIRLSSTVPRLAQLPWELLYDWVADDFFALSTKTPLIHYLHLKSPWMPPADLPPLRLLVMSCPLHDSPVSGGREEAEELSKEWAALYGDESVEITWVHGQTWRRLREALDHGPWHIFQFIGHGEFQRSTSLGYVKMIDPATGGVQLISADDLAGLLTGDSHLRLVILNTCRSAYSRGNSLFASTAAMLVRRGIPSVIAMQDEIGDRAAVEFSRELHARLAQSYPVDVALANARRAIKIADPSEPQWALPAFYTQASDGLVFRVARDLIVFSEAIDPAWHPLIKRLLAKTYQTHRVSDVPAVKQLQAELTGPALVFAEERPAEALLTGLRPLFDNRSLYMVALTPRAAVPAVRDRLIDLGAMLVVEPPADEPSLQAILRQIGHIFDRWTTEKTFVVEQGLSADSRLLAGRLRHGVETWFVSDLHQLKPWVRDTGGQRLVIVGKDAEPLVRARLGELVDDPMVQVIVWNAAEAHATAGGDPSALALDQLLPAPPRHNWRTHPFGLGRVRVDAWVEDPDPAPNTSVTVFGSLLVGGKPTPGAKMVATWWFRSGPQKESCITDAAGIGRSRLPIGGANLKYGYDVPVRITATYEENDYSAGTWFTRTPR